MNDRSERPPRSDAAQGHGSPPAMAIAVLLGAVAVALVGGYFFIMKLIDMGRTEDCLMSGRRNCAQIDVPARR
jgi:hypothetical protein